VNARCLSGSAAFLLLASALTGGAAERDAYGDLMPEGAKARLGTARLRVPANTVPILAPDGKSLFVQTSSGLLRLDPITGAVLGKPAVQVYGPVVALSADGRRVAIANANGATVRDLASGEALSKIERRLPSADAVALSADGAVLALGGTGDGIKKDPLTVLVWDAVGDKELKKIAVAQNESARVALSNNGRALATWGLHRVSEDKAPDPETNPERFVTFWDVVTGKEQAKFRVGGFTAAAVCFSPDGALAAVAGNNSSIDLVDTKTGTSKHLLLGRSRMGQALSFSPDGTTLAACAEDGAVQRWKVSDGSRLSTTEPPAAQLRDTRVRALSADKGIACGKRGAAVVVWEVPSGKVLSPEGGHGEKVIGVAVTPDGKHVLTSAEDGAVLKWELATGKSAGTVTIRVPNVGVGAYPSPAALSPDATRALVRDGISIGVHDLATGSQQYVIPTPLDGWTVAAFSPDGARVVVTTTNPYAKKPHARVTVWDAAKGTRLSTIELPGYGAVAAAITPDGKYVVTAGQKALEKGYGDFVVAAWEAATGAKKGEYTEGGDLYPPYAATAPDNKTAAVVTPKGKLIAFDLATGKLGKTYDLARRPFGAPVFSPDGKKLAIAGQIEYSATPHAPIYVLDWPSGGVKYTLSAPGGVPGAMAFSPDSKSLVTGLSDTTALVWDVAK
jgi:WD40 repeat protein